MAQLHFFSKWDEQGTGERWGVGDTWLGAARGWLEDKVRTRYI